ncbi:hypothetical protein THAOC_28647, partial [Thalassiosira oceanica]
QDPGYYLECKNNRLTRRDFKSNENCQAFIASLGSDVMKSSDVNPDAEAKAEQAAADLLSELGLGDLEGPSSSSSKKNNQSASGKKKKRVGKKKGRNSFSPPSPSPQELTPKRRELPIEAKCRRSKRGSRSLHCVLWIGDGESIKHAHREQVLAIGGYSFLTEGNEMDVLE